MIVFNDPEAMQKISELSETPVIPGFDVCIARRSDLDGEVMGGILLNNFTGASVTMHVAAFKSNWVNIDMMWVCFDYPFNKMSVGRIFGQVNENNKKAIDFNSKLGFKIIHRIEGVYPDGDMLLMEMRREDCRQLRLRPRRLRS